MSTYKIVRSFVSPGERSRTLETGLTLKQVQDHCLSPETCSETCTTSTGKARTRKHGEWADVWYEEKN